MLIRGDANWLGRLMLRTNQPTDGLVNLLPERKRRQGKVIIIFPRRTAVYNQGIPGCMRKGLVARKSFLLHSVATRMSMRSAPRIPIFLIIGFQRQGAE